MARAEPIAEGNGRTRHRDVVVIGGSHGSIQALREILSRLPASFPAAVLVVVHTAGDRDSELAKVLSSFAPCRPTSLRTASRSAMARSTSPFPTTTSGAGGCRAAAAGTA